MGRKNLFVVIIGLVALLMLASCQTARTEEPKEFCEISVQGQSTMKLDPDVVNFTVRVSETAPTTGEAQQKTNAKLSQILSILDSFGIEKKYIQTNQLSFSTDYSWEDGHQNFVAERVSQQVSVVMHDLDKFPSLVDQMGSKLTGIEFYSVDFDLEDKTESYKKARELAIVNAREKAGAYAVASGLTLGKPISISEGSAYVSNNRITYAAKAMAAPEAAMDSYSTEVPSGQLEISASISVVFQAR